MRLKRVLIISPYFPPSNAADMQRTRTSLPYFKDFDWEAVVVCIDEKHSDIVQDSLLLKSLPANQVIYKIAAFPKKWTQKIGFGGLGFRSLWHYRKKVNELLGGEKFDLVYFSTTHFPLCILGPYWQRKFGVPYVIDMQDPWYSEYYDQQVIRPRNYHFVYSVHKYLEARAMRHVDGLISVSDGYILDLKKRYPALRQVPASTITFGAFAPDLKIAAESHEDFKSVLEPGFKNIVYVGRGGLDMQKAVSPVFEALQRGLANHPKLFSKLKFYFIGTSYAPAGTGQRTILPVAKRYGVDSMVIEVTDRIGYYASLSTLLQADALFIPGSEDPKYTASKTYPYLLTGKPLLAVFNENSNTVRALKDCAENAIVLSFSQDTKDLTDKLCQVFNDWARGVFVPVVLSANFEKYSSKNQTLKQTALFDLAIQYYQTKKND